jgi:hypothetical protein
MNRQKCQSLRKLLSRFETEPAVHEIRGRLGADVRSGADPERMERLYQEALPLAERAMWSRGPDAATVELYQRSFRELEEFIAQEDNDTRHRFVVIIPVADRPQHLTNILESLLALCSAFGYGGVRDGRFRKVVAVIADDSMEEEAIERNKTIARRFDREGIDTHYFGAEAQAEQLERLTPEQRASLESILGRPEKTRFRHKGASANRNLAYLFARGLVRPGERHLFYFVDSDQQFRVRARGSEGTVDLAAVNYFHYLDRLFTEHPIQILTGKVVGDPPVSPAVMAGNFVGDVASFLAQVADEQAAGPCRFHAQAEHGSDGAAYHDMAELFGFTPAAGAFRYRCPLAGVHDHTACLAEFSHRLDRFFHGEHPTRLTLFAYKDGFLALDAARTVYTGNYVCTAAGLRHFIPFAPLRLRMAGPVLGRLVRAELGARFVSANLPMLHTRAADGEEQFEFRPGVNRTEAKVDLSGEFERQFFGDVMLFTTEKLIAQGFPGQPLTADETEQTLDAVERSLYRKYMTKRSDILARLDRTEEFFRQPEHWWNRAPDLEAARENFERFFANIRCNFGEGAEAYRLIGAGAHRDARRRAILDAIAGYGADRSAWEAVLDSTTGERP